jgi:integrase
MMGRKASGTVIEIKGKKDTTFAIRVTVGGKKHYQTVGGRSEGFDKARAEAELRHVMADVERGRWQPPVVAPIEPPQEVPSFHRFATDWFDRQLTEGGRRGEGLTPNGRADTEWRLSKHLLKTFASKRLDAITIEDVDAFRGTKVREGLSATSINKLLDTLSAILEVAVEYGYINRNPAKGKRRRLPSATPQRSWLDKAEHIEALLDGAGDLDKKARVRHGQRRALIAVLAFAGLRIDEALSLCWQDIDLARGTITVRDGKTVTAARKVYVLPALRDELDAYKSRLNPAPDVLVFGTTTGAKQGATNVRRRILSRAVEHANKQLAKKKAEPLPAGLTPHSLRRTFASILFAMGEAPPYVIAQLGHADPTVTLRFYAKVMDRRDGEPQRLKALVKGDIETQKDRNRVPAAAEHVAGRARKPVESGIEGA